MFRPLKIFLLLILLATSGEAHCPSNRIVADKTKRRNDTFERARLAAGVERRRARKTASYAEEDDSCEDGSDGDAYLTNKQKQNKKATATRKENRKEGDASRKRKPSSANSVSKKRGRPAKTILKDDVIINEDNMAAPKKRGRKPKDSLGHVEKSAETIESTVLDEIMDSVEIGNYSIDGTDNVQIDAPDDIEIGGLCLNTPVRRRSKPIQRKDGKDVVEIYREFELDSLDGSISEENVNEMMEHGELWKTPAAERFAKREMRIKAEEGAHRPSRIKMRKHRNKDESSEADDSMDDIPSPRNLSPCRLGSIEECPYCSAEHYPGIHVCCDKGSVFIKPMKKLPPELYKLMFGKGVNAKKFRKQVLSYNNAYSFASIQYHRIPAAAHGVQSVKVQGIPGHFPSCALPFAGNDPVYGNVYLYHGQESETMRLNVYNRLDKEIIRDLDVCMNRDNHFAHYYRNLGELIREEEKTAKGYGDYVRMKIVNANEVDRTQLQAHKGVYRKVLQGGDHVALFFQASAEQDVKLPGLIIYPKRSKNTMLPLFHWDAKATPLCYPFFCPYGEYAYGNKLYPLMKGDQRKLSFRERLENYALKNLEDAKVWEVDLDVANLISRDNDPMLTQMAGDISLEEIEGNDGVEEEDGVDEQAEENELQLRFSNEHGEDGGENLDGREIDREDVEMAVERGVDTVAEDIIGYDMNVEDIELDFQDAITPADDPIQPIEWNDFESDDIENNTRSFENNGIANEIEPTEDDMETDGTEEGENGPKKNGPRIYASLKQYITYIYQRRKLIANRFLRGDKLGQLFLIDHFMRMLSQRYNFIREKCAEYMTSTKAKMLKARQRLADKLKLGITIGAQFSVPHTVPGSPRWLQQKFENAVAMCNAFGRPDLFITATCNVNWPEIKDRIPAGETWADHPFLVNEVFKKKLDQLMDLLNGKGIDKKTKKRNKGLFGRVKWHTYSVEFQQRGPPHAHIVASLKKKPKTVVQIDKICQAVLPANNPRLRKLVEDFMIHSPCEGDATAYCRADVNPTRLQCKKGFPKAFNDVTKAGDRYYPELLRPNDGEHCSKNKKADNRYVVPYNTQLLTYWEGHINLEVISVLSIVKYIFKYLFKGFDRALVEIASGADSLDKDAMTIDGHLVLPKNIDIPEGKLKQRRKDAENLLRKRGIPLVDDNGRPTVVYNEFWIVEDMRAVTSCEAAWEFAGYERHSASHIVINNSIHAEDEERLVYTAEDQDEMLDKIQKEDFKTKLKAWFKLNVADSNAHDYTFADLPLGYIFEKGEWRPRKRRINNLVTRIKGINPRYKELYAIRLLCMNLRGIKSFKELRTVNDTVYETAVEAAKAHGLMNDKMEWDLCLAEASNYDNPKALRRLFCQIIMNNPVTTAYTRELYEKYKVYFYVNKRWDEKQLEAHCLYHIQSCLAANGSSLEEHGLPSLQNENLLAEDLIDDSGRHLYNERLSKREASALKKTMTAEQKTAYNTIIRGIETGEQTTFFLQGSGGTGKTRIMKALFHEFQSQKKKVACVAQTGIAASLLPIGSTAHRRFQIPLSAEENMNSTADLESDEAEYLKQLDLIIWDEATMADRRILQCVHKLLSTLRYGESNKIFGGCPCIFAGDWKQTLPVVPEAPGEAVLNYTAIEWPWWKEVQVIHLLTNMRAKDDPKFAEYCAKVGSGDDNVNPGTRAVDQLVKLPINRLVGSTKEVIKRIYGSEGSPEEKREVLRKSAILAVDNETVFDLNDKVLGLLNTTEHCFKSIDEHDPKNGFQALDPETYHLPTPNGYPRHELKLKVGAVVMLLRNMNVFRGMTNGTRLIVEEIGVHIIRCTPLNPERHMPKDILLHRVLFTPAGVLSREISFTRMQFPIRLAFSMTCNKAQGQTLDRCGLVLTTPCFAHGQLYVALSRVRKEEDLVIYNAADNPVFTNNVVYRKVFSYEEKSANGREGRATVISNYPAPTENNNLSVHESDTDQEDADNDGYVSEEEAIGAETPLSRNRPGPVSTLMVEQGIFTSSNISSAVALRRGPPSLLNLGNTCYANAISQLLLRIWNDKITDYTEDNRCILALKGILSGEKRDAAALLRSPGLPKRYRNFGVQQSAAELFASLMDLLPPSFTNELIHVHKCIGVCTGCETVGRIGAVDDQHSMMVLNGQLSNYPTFTDYMDTFMDPHDIEKACDTCNVYSIRHIARWRAEIPEDCKYLVVEMGLFISVEGGPVRRRQRQIGMPDSAVELFGKVFKPIAAIWHRGTTPNVGHYKAFVEKNGVWWECDDAKIFPSRLPEAMDGVAVMVLEKVVYEEEVEENMEVEDAGPSMQDDRQARRQTLKKLLIEQGSIVAVNSQTIVNAANSELKPGGGVDGIIRNACGPTMINAATKKIKNRLPNKMLAPGQVVPTRSFLMTRYQRIYHTAAPYIQPGRQPTRAEEDHLRRCYFNCLSLADREGQNSIAFPVLGIGLFNYDERKGMAVALQAIFAYFEVTADTNLDTVIIVVISSRILKMLQSLVGGKAAHLLDPLSAGAARRTLEELMVESTGEKDVCSLPGVPAKLASFLD